MKSREKRRMLLESLRAFRATPTILRRASAWPGIPAIMAKPLSAPAMGCFTVIRCWRSLSIRPSPTAAARRNSLGLAERRRRAQARRRELRISMQQIFFRGCSAVCRPVLATFRTNSVSTRCCRIRSSSSEWQDRQRQAGSDIVLVDEDGIRQQRVEKLLDRQDAKNGRQTDVQALEPVGCM